MTEAVYFIERMIEVLAIELNMDAAELRRINFIKKNSFHMTQPLAGNMTAVTITLLGIRRSKL